MTEPLTGYSESSSVKYNKDVYKIEEEEFKQQDETDTPYDEDLGTRIYNKAESIEVTYDKEGKEKTKIVSNYINHSINNKNELYYNSLEQVEYSYENGEPVETKRTEHLMTVCDSKTITETKPDGSKTYTINIKNTEGTENLETGGGYNIHKRNYNKKIWQIY